MIELTEKKPLKILFVDDEENVIHSLVRLFVDEDFEILTASSSLGGLEIARNVPDLSVIVSDQSMPFMSGWEFLEKVRALVPDAVRIMLTGHADVEAAINAINQGGAYRYITKPWNDRDLVLVVRDAAEKYKLLIENRYLTELTKKQNEELANWNTQLEELVRVQTIDIQNKNNQLQEALTGTVRAMASVVESRDPYTAGHQKRVAELAVAIASEMGLPIPQIEGIGMAAVIHDLGKIAVPAEILSKPTKLKKSEFAIIQDHPQSGYEILKTIDFPWPIARIVLEHHEKMDGTGYPNGLVGNNMLLESKILTVADVIEAMSSHRPYRPALGIDAALKEIEKNKGTCYDATVVDTCLSLFREKGFQLEND